jgi:hypothetical protein
MAKISILVPPRSIPMRIMTRSPCSMASKEDTCGAAWA